MTSKAYILVAEDDRAIATGLAMNLELEGYRTQVADDGEIAIQLLKEDDKPDLLLLDIAMPKKDGLEVLSELRDKGNSIPIIMLSARLSESDKVAALRLGADDYVTKPFALAELMARIAAVLRRSQNLTDSQETQQCLQFGEVSVDRNNRTVSRNGAPVSMTHLEFELLCFFMDHPEQVLAREHLLRKVWGTTGSKRTIDNFVGQLRSKLETDAEDPIHFLTVRGSGYRFVP